MIVMKFMSTRPNYRDDAEEEESGYLITVVTLKSWWYLDIKVLNIVRRYHN